VFLFVFVWFRGTLPRFRYDQLMDLGWKRLIPLSLVWLLFVAVVRIGRDRDWSPLVAPASLVVMLVVVFGLLGIALRSARQRQDTAAELEVA
jgi:NADH-quinone oxidoreductase subunit H